LRRVGVKATTAGKRIPRAIVKVGGGAWKVGGDLVGGDLDKPAFVATVTSKSAARN
jgi:hypothetical protein